MDMGNCLLLVKITNLQVQICTDLPQKQLYIVDVEEWVSFDFVYGRKEGNSGSLKDL